mmetsp:Transcript_11005/g.26903  ORF Transcript_11005/g.26903 Transcript_11005/m.26903 type:complete len:312 (+) Transcript_11005:2848-3783(+)
MLDVEVRGGELSLFVVKHRVDEVSLVLRAVTDIIPVLLQPLEHAKDGAKDVQVGGGPDVTLVGGEGEDGDGELLVDVLFLAERGPLDGAAGDLRRAVLQSVGLASLGVAPGEDDGLEAAVQLGESHLERHLHGVQAQGGVLPLLGGLEGQRHRDHVRHVELLQRVDRLRVVLASRATHEGEPGERQHGVDVRVLGNGVEKVLLDRDREVEAAGEDGDDLGAAGLELHHHASVVSIVASDQVRALKHHANHGRVLGKLHVLAGVVPVQVLLEVRVHGGRGGVPDAEVREGDRLGDLHLHVSQRRDVGFGDHE